MPACRKGMNATAKDSPLNLLNISQMGYPLPDFEVWEAHQIC